MNKTRPTITGLLITYNEEKHLAEVVDNMSFVDELIVVDSFSTDGTIDLLKGMPMVKVIQHKFKNFSDQRNFAIEQASMDWILFLDADERLTEELKHEMLQQISIPSNIIAYTVKRQFIYKDKALNFSGLQTDFSFRLFKKGSAKYNAEQKVHETLNPLGATKSLKNHLLHYSFTNYKDYKQKMEHYAQLNALELFEQGKKASFYGHYIKPAYKFLYNYIFRLGFLDGKAGYEICKLHAYGVKHRYKILDALTS